MLVTLLGLALGCSEEESVAGVAKTEAGDEKKDDGEAEPADDAEEVVEIQTWCGDEPCPCEQEPSSPDEKVSNCTLTEDIVIQGLPMAKGKMVSFNKEGEARQFTLSENSRVGDYNCRNTGPVTTHGPGKLKGCYTDEQYEISGVPCDAGSLSIQKDGKLRRCKVAKKATVGPLEMPAGSYITLWENGEPERFENSGAIDAPGGYACKGYMNYLHEDGKLKKCELANDAKVGDKDVKAGETVCWDAEGAPTDCSNLKFRMM
jgi:hypothetical protein